MVSQSWLFRVQRYVNFVIYLRPYYVGKWLSIWDRFRSLPRVHRQWTFSPDVSGLFPDTWRLLRCPNLFSRSCYHVWLHFCIWPWGVSNSSRPRLHLRTRYDLGAPHYTCLVCHFECTCTQWVIVSVPLDTIYIILTHGFTILTLPSTTIR